MDELHSSCYQHYDQLGGKCDERNMRSYIQYKNYSGVTCILMILCFLSALISELFHNNINLMFTLKLVCILLIVSSVNVSFVFYNGRYLFYNTTVSLMWSLVSLCTHTFLFVIDSSFCTLYKNYYKMQMHSSIVLSFG